MFELKKVVSAMLMPLPALLLIGLLGLALISFTTKRKTGCFVVLFSFVGIFLVAFQPVSTKLLMPLEREHKAFFASFWHHRLRDGFREWSCYR